MTSFRWGEHKTAVKQNHQAEKEEKMSKTISSQTDFIQRLPTQKIQAFIL